MADKLKLILWFLNFDKLDISNKEIQHLTYINGIPMFLFYRKLIERIYKKDKDIDYYIDYLKNENILDKAVIIDNEFNIKLSTILKDINAEQQLLDATSFDDHALVLFAKNYLNFITENAKEHNYHQGQPLPDKDKGRPIIDWLYCAYEGCCKKFKNGNELISHLESFNCYIARYHTFHEEIVKWKYLNPDKIRECGMTKCPAIICKEGSYTSPDGLINHLTRLGIAPFWKPGMIITNNHNYELKDQKYFKVDECVICLDKRPDVICYPCLHLIYCLRCYSDMKVSKCPMCRENIHTIYPFAT